MRRYGYGPASVSPFILTAQLKSMLSQQVFEIGVIPLDGVILLPGGVSCPVSTETPPAGLHELERTPERGIDYPL